MSEKTSILELRHIQQTFDMPSNFLQRQKPKLYALRDVSFKVTEGETFCVVGESGCGKTTIGRVIMGLLAPTDGQVLYQDKVITGLSNRQRQPYRSKMGMVFQNPHASLNPRMSIEQALSEPLKVLSPELSKAAILEKLATVLLSVGGDPLWLKKMPHEFSGGQRQRISLARALVTDPEFIVADEPVSALDVSIQAQVLNLLSDLQQQRKLTYFFITHDLSVVQHFGHRVAVMYLGSVVEIRTVSNLFSDPKHPYTQLLLSAIPKLSGGAFAEERPIGELPNPMSPPSGCAFRTRCPLATDRCAAETPTLRPIDQGSGFVACHYA